MKVGFTGSSQKALSPLQAQFLINYAQVAQIEEFHHGDCIGADAEAHDIFHMAGIPIMIHPPENPAKRAFKLTPGYTGGLQNGLLPPKPYLKRNRDIVMATDVLIACPAGPEILHSGTWSTVRFARSLGRRIFIIMPEGLKSDVPLTL